MTCIPESPVVTFTFKDPTGSSRLSNSDSSPVLKHKNWSKSILQLGSPDSLRRDSFFQITKKLLLVEICLVQGFSGRKCLPLMLKNEHNSQNRHPDSVSLLFITPGKYNTLVEGFKVLRKRLVYKLRFLKWTENGFFCFYIPTTTRTCF